MRSNERLLDAVVSKMDKLGKRFGEDTIFVSRRVGNKVDHATVIMNLICDTKDDDECYLAIRRLLDSFAYRFNEKSNFEVSFTLTRKEK